MCALEPIDKKWHACTVRRACRKEQFPYKQITVRYEMDDRQYLKLRQFVDAVEHAVRTRDVSTL